MKKEGKNLFMEYQAIYPSVWENASRRDEIFSYAEGYKVFLNCCKTERDAVRYIRTLALENGFVKTDAAMRTNIPGLFAAGDMTGKPLQVANAVGDGLVAALAAVDYLDGVSPMTD